MLYGIAEGLWLLALSDAILAIATALVLVVLHRSGTNPWANVRVALGVASVMVVVAVIDAVWLGWLAGVISVVLRYPQMRLVRGASSIEGVSLSTWNVAAATNACWCAYGVLHGDPRLAIATAVNVAITAALVRSVLARRATAAQLDPAA